MRQLWERIKSIARRRAGESKTETKFETLSLIASGGPLVPLLVFEMKSFSCLKGEILQLLADADA